MGLRVDAWVGVEGHSRSGSLACDTIGPLSVADGSLRRSRQRRLVTAGHASCEQLSLPEDDRVRVMNPVQPCTVKRDWKRAVHMQVSQRSQHQHCQLTMYGMLTVNRVGDVSVGTPGPLALLGS